MHWQYAPIVWIYLASAIIAGGMAIYAWRQRSVAGSAAFAVMQSGAALWAAGYAVLISRSDLSSILFFANVSWTGAALEAPACLVMALQFANRTQLSRRALLGHAFMPALTLAVVWTSYYHNLIRYSVYLKKYGSLTILERTQGLWYWIYFYYSYVLIAIIVFTLLRSAWRETRGRRIQPLILMIGLLVSG
ncbi:MAG TPA: histidine kinase N-terminal 7TM domain-containing protein, partial [Candidatus Angelobacter sp.]|nr:histidine kinase N-terminal 7TM domain-containing protein [Candidatus Angelobacter sp.]